jgi:hypothetical protein
MEAIHVTRALGIHYLWIHSLCILQDSSVDWAIHAPQIAAVYGNSYVTISADAVEDSTVVFLNGSNRYRLASTAVPFACSDQGGAVWAGERGKLAYQLPYHDWPVPSDPPIPVEYPPTSLLSTRGWVFQERILSPRTLHFSKAELGFECRSMITCESSFSKRYRRTNSLLKQALTSMSWYAVVGEYTSLQLTKETDGLAALSGLVAARQLLTGEEISYGMLMTDLERGLVWQNSIPNIGQRLSIAPPWSWASTAAAIVYPLQWSDEMNTPPPSDWRSLGVVACPYLNSSLGRDLVKEELILEECLLPLKAITDTGRIFKRYRKFLLGLRKVLNFYWDTNEPLHLQEDRCTLFITTGPPGHPKGLILEDLPNLPSPLLVEVERGRPSISSPHVLPHVRRVGCVRDFPVVNNDSWSTTTPSEDVTLDGTPVTWDWKGWKACSTRQLFAII